MGQEDPLEEEVATHSNILAWEIPWTEEAGGLQSVGLQRVRHDSETNTHTHTHTHTYTHTYLHMGFREVSPVSKVTQPRSGFSSFFLCPGVEERLMEN